MFERDRRAVLWLCCAGVCWRWVVGKHTPMPTAEACEQLWLAQRLAVGDFTPAVAVWWRALPALLMAPAIAVGAPAVATAKVLAALAGGLAVAPTALAAERLRQGAGVGAAAVAMAGGAAVLEAGAGGSSATASLLVALALWAAAGRRRGLAGLVAVTAAPLAMVAPEPDRPSLLQQVWLGAGPAAALAPLVLLRPRSAHFVVPAAALLLGLVAGLATGELVAAASAVGPALAVLVGVALARFGRRWRDLLLCVVVAAQCHTAWTSIAPASAVAERVVAGYLLGSVLDPGQRLATDLPRVAWAAGAQPVSIASAEELRRVVADPQVGAVVLGGALVGDASLRAWLAGRFVVVGMPADLEDLAAERHLVVLVRRT
ncbi:MAG: hypothetical protein H6835_04710 [Planctomycetes bacterium]|nr:hypothetical protein [Planctomycetota bacterium]